MAENRALALGPVDTVASDIADLRRTIARMADDLAHLKDLMMALEGQTTTIQRFTEATDSKLNVVESMVSSLLEES